MDAASDQKRSSDSAIREELDRVLASQAFLTADRRARLLRFQVDDSLKESVIAIEVFDRVSDYDPKLESIVRVEMGRLRSRLTEYYAQTGANDPVRIEVPKGGYQPAFAFTGQEPTQPTPLPSRRMVGGPLAIPLGIGII